MHVKWNTLFLSYQLCDAKENYLRRNIINDKDLPLDWMITSPKRAIIISLVPDMCSLRHSMRTFHNHYDTITQNQIFWTVRQENYRKNIFVPVTSARNGRHSKGFIAFVFPEKFFSRMFLQRTFKVLGLDRIL